MKSLKIIFLIFFTLLISCNKKQELKREKIENDSVIVYNEDEYYKTKSKKIKVIDTTCDFEEQRAEKDIKQGKLTYTFIYGIGVYDISNKEMNELLSKYSIKLNKVSMSCSRPPKGFKWNCYAKLMNLAIEKKFGEKFIDSLRNIADKQFVEKNPNFIFSFFDCETTSRYVNAKSYEEFLEKPESDFMIELNYPKLSKEQIKKEKANTEVTFVIYRNGTVGRIKVESDFKIAGDLDFARYFEKEAINFVKKAKWKSALYRGIKVNSDMHLNLYNK
ncbi:hypothetical protein [Flavobacterium sp.]|uniref:hypothetical protein n=1 Tax=Flavobacterium sp. TaxID=239 RepID=UPI0032673900